MCVYIYIYTHNRNPRPEPRKFRMHTFPDEQWWMHYGLTHNSMYLEMGFETLDCCSFELNL